MAVKKYISLSKLAIFLENLNDKFAVIGHRHKISDISDYVVDNELSSTSNNPVANKVIDAEFEAITNSMNTLDLAIDGKADVEHTHDEYYTETEVDGKLEGKADSDDLTSHTEDTSNPHNVTAEQAGALPITGGELTGILYTSASTPFLIGRNGKVGMRAATDDNINVGQINVSNAWYEGGNQWGAQISAYNGATGKYNEFRVSHDGMQYNAEDGTVHKVLHDGNVVEYAVPLSRTINGKALSDNIVLSASDVEADAKGAAADALDDAKYYTDTVASGKSDTTHNHDDDYDAKGSANTALESANAYTDTKVSGLASTTTVDTKITTHNTATDAHNDIRALITELSTAVNKFLDVDDTTTDQLSEVLTLIENNKGTLESLTTTKVNVSDIIDNLTTSDKTKVLSANQGVAIKSLIDALQEELDTHGHEIADVNGLQTALNKKADSDHGTHVTYSTTAPVMDGTATVGTANTVPRGDHRHPTDTSRAAKTDFDTHVADTTKHLTATERTNWNAAYTHTSNKSNPHGVTLTQLGVTATTAELNKMDGVTATTAELNYVDGVTSNIQAQLNAKVAKAGDTMTGALNFANGVWNKVGDDAYFGDNNTAGSFAIKGANGTTNLKMVASNDSTNAMIQYDHTNECLNFVFA